MHIRALHAARFSVREKNAGHAWGFGAQLGLAGKKLRMHLMWRCADAQGSGMGRLVRDALNGMMVTSGAPLPPQNNDHIKPATASAQEKPSAEKWALGPQAAATVHTPCAQPAQQQLLPPVQWKKWTTYQKNRGINGEKAAQSKAVVMCTTHKQANVWRSWSSVGPIGASAAAPPPSGPLKHSTAPKLHSTHGLMPQPPSCATKLPIWEPSWPARCGPLHRSQTQRFGCTRHSHPKLQPPATTPGRPPQPSCCHGPPPPSVGPCRHIMHRDACCHIRMRRAVVVSFQAPLRRASGSTHSARTLTSLG